MRLLKSVPMVGLEVFLPELVLSAPEVPSDIAASYVRQSVIAFAEQSNRLRREIIIESQAGVEDYLLEPPDCTHTNKIVQVCDARGGRYYVQPGQICEPPCGVSCVDICGPGNWFPMTQARVFFEHPNTLHIRPIPKLDIELGYVVEVSVIPDRDACEVDEIVYQRYAPVIVAGALSDLQMQHNKPWSNTALSKVNGDKFRLGCARGLGDALIGSAHGNQRLVTRRIL